MTVRDTRITVVLFANCFCLLSLAACGSGTPSDTTRPTALRDETTFVASVAAPAAALTISATDGSTRASSTKAISASEKSASQGPRLGAHRITLLRDGQETGDRVYLTVREDGRYPALTAALVMSSDVRADNIDAARARWKCASSMQCDTAVSGIDGTEAASFRVQLDNPFFAQLVPDAKDVHVIATSAAFPSDASVEIVLFVQGKRVAAKQLTYMKKAL